MHDAQLFRHALDVRDAEIGCAPAHVFEHRAVHTFPDVYLHLWALFAINLHDSGETGMGDRHHGRYDDLSAHLLRFLLHALGRDLQVVQDALRDGGKRASFLGDLDAPGGALEKCNAEHTLDTLDDPR